MAESDSKGPPSRDRSETTGGAAGASARREHARRRASRERRVRERHPLIGGALLALGSEPAHERAWARGAAGEERVAQVFAAQLEHNARVLHDRRIPGSRANIDHIVIAPSGVWVIDAKRYKGRVAVSKPLLGRAKLTVGGRDRTKLVEGVGRQVGLVRVVVAEVAPTMPVHGALCFVEGDLPVFGTLQLDGCLVLGPKRLAKRINAGGQASGGAITAVSDALTQRLPAA